MYLDTGPLKRVAGHEEIRDQDGDGDGGGRRNGGWERMRVRSREVEARRRAPAVEDRVRKLESGRFAGADLRASQADIPYESLVDTIPCAQYGDVRSPDVRTRFLLPSGDEKWIQFSSMPSPQPFESQVLWSGVILDLTERKTIEAEKNQLLLDLRAAQAEIVTLEGILIICSCCKKLRNDDGTWERVDT